MVLMGFSCCLLTHCVLACIIVVLTTTCQAIIQKLRIMVDSSVVTTKTSACPSGDERVMLFGLLLETNARLSRRLGLALEAECDLPLAWFEVLVQLRRAEDRSDGPGARCSGTTPL